MLAFRTRMSAVPLELLWHPPRKSPVSKSGTQWRVGIDTDYVSTERKKTPKLFSRLLPAVLPVEISDSWARHLSEKFTNIYPPVLPRGSHNESLAPWILSHDPYSADRRRYRTGLSAERVPDSGWDLRHACKRRRPGRARGPTLPVPAGPARRDYAH